MNNLLKLEELGMFAISLYLFSLLDYSWWVFAVLFLAPDIGMIGYLINTKVGAVTYNILHHKGVTIGFYLAGIYLNMIPLQFAGILLFAHSSFDRILGYGLKYSDNFKHTHLGWIGKTE